MTPTCSHCGNPLQVISSVASDPHDPPVYDCPCWPIDWLAAIVPIVFMALFAGVLYGLAQLG